MHWDLEVPNPTAVIIIKYKGRGRLQGRKEATTQQTNKQTKTTAQEFLQKGRRPGNYSAWINCPEGG